MFGYKCKFIVRTLDIFAYIKLVTNDELFDQPLCEDPIGYMVNKYLNDHDNKCCSIVWLKTSSMPMRQAIKTMWKLMDGIYTLTLIKTKANKKSKILYYYFDYKL